MAIDRRSSPSGESRLNSFPQDSRRPASADQPLSDGQQLMTLENTRLDQAFAILDSLQQTGSAADRFFTALQELNGIILTGLSDSVRDAIESFGLKYNAIRRGHPAESPESFPKLSDEEADELVVGLRQVAELIRDTESERILNRLHNHDSVLPEAEVIEARRHREWFVPYLLSECREQIEKLKKLEYHDDTSADDQTSSVPFFSLFLFSEWGIDDSVPVIMEGMSLPGEAPFALFGDAVHSQLPKYLAQFLANDLDRIDALITDPQANLYVRWSSANSYKYLVRDQIISIDDAVTRLEHLFHQTKIADDNGRPGAEHPYELSAGLLDVICSIGGASRTTISTDNKNWDFIDEAVISTEDVSELSEIADDEEATAELRRLPPTRVEDWLEELRFWASFRLDDKPFSRTPAPSHSKPARPAIPPRSAANLPPAVVKPVKQPARVPRNAMCPCGSGKKYKQCCLRKQG